MGHARLPWAVAVVLMTASVVPAQTSPSAMRPTPPTKSTPGQKPAVPPSPAGRRPSVSTAPPSPGPPPAVTSGAAVPGVTVPLTSTEAVRLALEQASSFQQATFNERIADEDVRQARAAFLPRIAGTPSFIFTSPSSAGGTPRTPAFLGANAITEYQGLVNVSGELDVSRRLRATLQRNVALLEAARAGTEVARRTLALATNETYYGLALAAARRQAAERNLAATQEFERATGLLLRGGEVPAVDLLRARLQTRTRRDELEQARAAEAAAADALRVFVGYDFARPIAATDLLAQTPPSGEIERFAAEAVARRPEFAQFAAERRAADQDVRLARAERRPQITYSVNGGFVSDALSPGRIGEHTGVSATIGVSIPLLDQGVSRSRERQAQLRAQAAETARIAAQRGFAQQFFTARAQALAAVTRVGLARAGVADAERNLAVSVARYRAGEAPVIEVTDAQNALVAQRAALYQALFDYQLARARLVQATGQ